MDLASAPCLSERSFSPEVQADKGQSLRLVSLAEASSIQFLAAWENLSHEACEPNPFFEPWFVIPSLEKFGNTASPTGKNYALFAYSCQGKLAGLLPVAWGQRYYRYPVPHIAAWLHDNAFCGSPLVAKGHERSYWRALLERLDREPGRALFLHLPQLPAAGPMAVALNEVLAETSRLAVTVQSAERAMLASEAAPLDYLDQSMSAKKRKELRRQRRRLAEEGDLVFERCDNAEGADQWIADFLTLEAAGWKGDAGSALASAADTSGFFASVIAGAAEAGRLERLSLRLDGRPIAMLANFVCPPGIYSFKTAFDEAYSRYSPGLLLQLENLDILARGDIGWADSCAAEGHSMIERLWREKRHIVSRNIAIGGPLRRFLFKQMMAYEMRKRSGI
jgi:CelD/BcsL family acetyltransferase involved in cellulose biosynthesis